VARRPRVKNDARGCPRIDFPLVGRVIRYTDSCGFSTPARSAMDDVVHIRRRSEVRNSGRPPGSLRSALHNSNRHEQQPLRSEKCYPCARSTVLPMFPVAHFEVPSPQSSPASNAGEGLSGSCAGGSKKAGAVPSDPRPVPDPTPHLILTPTRRGCSGENEPRTVPHGMWAFFWTEP
jgi:hypothetical protein